MRATTFTLKVCYHFSMGLGSLARLITSEVFLVKVYVRGQGNMTVLETGGYIKQLFRIASRIHFSSLPRRQSLCESPCFLWLQLHAWQTVLPAFYDLREHGLFSLCRILWLWMISEGFPCTHPMLSICIEYNKKKGQPPKYTQNCDIFGSWPCFVIGSVR